MINPPAETELCADDDLWVVAFEQPTT